MCLTAKAADGVPKKDVGIFYFVWMGQHPSEQTGNYDITKLLEEHPEDLYDVKGTPLSPLHKYHFWSEPLYGYYNSADPWVIARHIELFMAAGVDYLVLDTTNGFCYPEVVHTLLETLLAFQKKGLDVPKVSFYTNGASGRVVKELFYAFYVGGRYDSLWYAPKGRPMIIGVSRRNKGTTDQGNPDYIREEHAAYFDVRESQWPTKPSDKEAFPWMDWEYPQVNHNGIVSVSVAQHSTKKILFSDLEYGRGRGYDAPTGKNLHGEVRSGHNFQNQWNTALAGRDDVSNVFMTGWNEWVAIKYVFDGKVGFVDTFNEEFSRDIEMMKGGYGDSFYLQMARNIRAFKGEEPSLTRPEVRGGEWLFRDPEGDALERDFQDFAGTGRYVDSSCRNDITGVSVSEEGNEIRFTVTTAGKVSGHEEGDTTWMNILVRTNLEPGNGFPYDFVIGRHPSKDGKTSVERITASGKHVCGEARWKVSGKKMSIVVPMGTLGLQKGAVHFFFKAADHVARPDDIMDYYVSGDSAPIGRLDYEYGRRNVLYSRLMDDGAPLDEYSLEGGVDAAPTPEGLKVNGAGGHVRLDRYYSLGERTARFTARFSPDALAVFRSNSGDFNCLVDAEARTITVAPYASDASAADKAVGQGRAKKAEVPFLDPSHEYSVEIGHDYLTNSALLTDLATGKSVGLSLTSDGAGGVGKGALQEGYSAGSMWDYYCFGLLRGTSMTVRRTEVLSTPEKVFLMIYGDSITQPDGYFPRKDFPQAWTMQIASNVKGKAVCSGRGGCTINEVLLRIPNELPYIRPEYVMVTIGTNGGNTEENLSRLVEYILSQGAVPILNNIPCNESGTQVAANELIARVREKYGLKGCKFDLATSIAGDGLEVDKSMMFWENYPPEVFNGWQVWHHPNSKGGTAMYLRSRQDVPELY